jgi:hypothetical protein
MSLARSNGIRAALKDRGIIPQLIRNEPNVSDLKALGGKASPASTEVSRVQAEADLVHRIAELVGLTLKSYRQIKGGLALSGVHQRRCVEGALLGGRQDLHPGHERVSFQVGDGV